MIIRTKKVVKITGVDKEKGGKWINISARFDWD